MNMKERFLASMRREDVDRVTCACPLPTSTLALMKRCGAKWPEAFRDPKKMATLSAAAHKIAGIESAMVPDHLCVEAEAMGCDISAGKIDSQPYITAPVIKKLEDVERLKVPDPKINKSTVTILKAIKILRKKIGDDVPLVAWAMAPFTLASSLRGVENMMKDLMLNPEVVKAILSIAQETVITYTLALVEAGADVICLVDPTATGNMIGPKFYSKFACLYSKRVVKEIHRVEAPVVLHICGNSKPIWNYMVETEADMLSLGDKIDMAEAKDKIGDKVSLAGNISPVKVLQQGTPDDVERAVKGCVKKGVNDVCPGCGFAPRTPLENMKKIAEVCRSFG